METVINHVAEEHLSRHQIVMALINSAGYWQKKVILSEIEREYFNEPTGDK